MLFESVAFGILSWSFPLSVFSMLSTSGLVLSVQLSLGAGHLC